MTKKYYVLKVKYYISKKICPNIRNILSKILSKKESTL